MMYLDLKRKIQEDTRWLCKDLGFTYKKKFYIRENSEGISNALLFTYSQDKVSQTIGVNITATISLNSIESVKKALLEADDAVFSFTLSQDLGYLMPQGNYLNWFLKEEDFEVKLHEIKTAISAYAEPYFSKFSTPAAILSAIESRSERILNRDYNFYMPIIYLMRGEYPKGKRFVEEEIKRQEKVLSDEEFRKAYPFLFSEETKVLRAGKEHLTADEMEHLLKGFKSIAIGGLGSGKVDPTYLVFAWNYFKLIKDADITE